MSSTRFKPGEVRTFIKRCDTCDRDFESRSGSRKRCPGCCRCKHCDKQMPNATTVFCSQSCAGKWRYRNAPEVRAALKVGQTHPARIEAVASAARKRTGPRPNMRGKNNPNWKGGTYDRHTAMGRIEYSEWRTSIFQRDDYTCQECGVRGGKLNAHHVCEWRDFPGFRYSLENGVTLCVSCHKGRHHKR